MVGTIGKAGIPWLCLGLCLLITVGRLYALEEVGKVISFSGEVYFDVAGKSQFIPPVVGDILYDCSVIKTGRSGRATLIVNKEEIPIPPASLIYLTDILSTNPALQRIDRGIYRQLTDLITGIVKNYFEGSEKSKKGTTETKRKESRTQDFISETEADAEFLASGEQAFFKADYSQALLFLLAVQSPSSLDLPLSEYYQLTGFSYFFLGHYPQAEAFFAKCDKQLADDTVSMPGAPLKEALLISRGISSYLAHQDLAAALYYKNMLRIKEETALTPYAYYFLGQALNRLGTKREAKRYLETALELYGMHPLRPAWLQLLKEL